MSEDDPLRVRTTTETAALNGGAGVATMPKCGRLPWPEQPAAFRAAIDRPYHDRAMRGATEP